MAELEKKTDKAEDLKKALSLFTFQGQMERYKPQRGSRLPLVPMLASLREMSPRQWAAYAFDRDPGTFRQGAGLRAGGGQQAAGHPPRQGGAHLAGTGTGPEH